MLYAFKDKETNKKGIDFKVFDMEDPSKNCEESLPSISDYAEASLTISNNIPVLIGGYDFNNPDTYSNLCFSYSKESNSWTNFANLTNGRLKHTAIDVDGDLF